MSQMMMGVAIQAATVAIASRLVGSSFRIAESYSPKLQASSAIMKPDVVLKREGATLVLSWVFSMAANLCIAPLAKRYGWKHSKVNFLTAFFGTLAAESIGRSIAYREVLKNPPKEIHSPPALPKPVLPEHAATVTHDEYTALQPLHKDIYTPGNSGANIASYPYPIPTYSGTPYQPSGYPYPTWSPVYYR